LTQSLERPSDPAGLGEGIVADKPVPVVSVVMFRDQTKSEILLGVRRASQDNPRHPGVLSTPTLRVPDQIFSLLKAEAGVCPAETHVQLPPDHPTFEVGRNGYMRSIPAFVLESVCARKLGVGNALTQSVLTGTARAGCFEIDNVNDPQGTQRTELTAMLTYEMVINQGADCFPSETEAYSRLIWAPSNKVKDALRSRDALLLDQSLNPFEVCIDGLCVRSAVGLISVARQPNATMEPIAAR
jgi:hypothetical protein